MTPTPPPTGLRAKLLNGDRLVGTFMKTPSHVTLEVLILAGLDFVCIDAEHAPYDRAALDACLAVARAADYPVLVRVPSGTAAEILNVMDLGATGIVVPHVDTPEKAAEIAAAARFGPGGRGYAGSTRWAGYATRTMPDLLAKSAAETIVIAQIEEPLGVDNADAIAATPGIDALFIGPADLTVGYGHTDTNNADVDAAMVSTAAATRAHGKAYATWCPTAERAKQLESQGFSMFVVASEHAWMMQGARATMAALASE